MLDWFAARVSDDADQKQRARILAGALCGAVGLLLAVAILGLFVEGTVTPRFVVRVVVATALGVSLTVLRVTGNVSQVVHLAMTVCLCLLVANSYNNGGFHPGVLAGMVLAPMTAFFLGGVRAGIGWSLVALALIGLLAAAWLSGVDFPAALPARQNVIITTASLVAFVVVAWVISGLYETERTRAVARAREALAKAHRANDVLQRANQDLDAFARTVSHDLRGPARRTEHYARTMLEQYGDQLDDKGRHKLSRLHAQGARMQQLIDDLMTLARVAQVPMKPGSVDVSAMAHEVMGRLQERDPERVVAVDIAAGMVVGGDAALLRIALDNLLGNAWKYTSQTDGACIRVGCERDGAGRAALCIEDNGAGFDMAYADKLFEPFQRLHSEREFEGNGVGLATVKRITELHGGTIGASGEVGSGASFTLVLP
ncbi:MAG: signal transduction histidine kinase [Myxococcota bacterium]|jgi:signal transduction histidine kinase